MSEVALPAPRPRQGNTAVFVLVGVAAVELVVFILGLAMGVQGWDAAILFLALATAFVGAFPIVFDLGRPPERRQFLISVLSLSYMVYIVVPVFSNYFAAKGQPVKGSFNLVEMAPTDIAHAQVAALIGLLMLIVGFYMPFGKFVVSSIPRPTREWSANATIVVAMMMLGVGWLLFVGRPLGLVPTVAGTGALGTVGSGSFLGIALLTLCWLRHGTRSVIPILLVVVPIATFFSFFTGSKRETLTPAAMIAVAYMVYERRIRKVWILAGFAMLVALYPIATFYRLSVQSEGNRNVRPFLEDPVGTLSQLSRFGQESEGGNYLTSGVLSTAKRLDGLGVFTVILRDTPERVPFQGFRTLSMIPLSYIPRFIWHDKPDLTPGIWVQQSYGSPGDLHTHVGPTWMGELYFSFGYPGIVVGMFFLGVFCRMLQERLFSPTATIPALLGAVIALYAITRSVQSALMAPVNGTVYHLVFLWFVHVLVGLFGGYLPQQKRDTGPSVQARSA